MSIFSRKAKNITTLHVSGMSCAACVSHVSRTLQNVPGVHHVRVDLTKSSAEIEGELAAQTLIEAVQSAGFEAQLA